MSNTFNIADPVKVNAPHLKHHGRIGKICKLPSPAFQDWIYVELALSGRERINKSIFIQKKELVKL